MPFLPLSKAPLSISHHTHAHAHTSKTPSRLSLCVSVRRRNGCVTFWWRNDDDHGSLSSPWRMDLIHSMLVCAYNYSTDGFIAVHLQESMKSICITLRLYGGAIQMQSWTYIQCSEWTWSAVWGGMYSECPTNAQKLNGCLTCWFNPCLFFH